MLHAAAVVMNCEGDIATYTVLALGDARVLNKQLHIRPPLNLLSQHDMAHIWEDKVRGRRSACALPLWPQGHHLHCRACVAADAA